MQVLVGDDSFTVDGVSSASDLAEHLGTDTFSLFTVNTGVQVTENLPDTVRLAWTPWFKR